MEDRKDNKLPKRVELNILMAELARLESLYKHYRKLYNKYRLFCCFRDTSSVNENKDYYKAKIKEAEEKVDSLL